MFYRYIKGLVDIGHFQSIILRPLLSSKNRLHNALITITSSLKFEYLCFPGAHHQTWISHWYVTSFTSHKNILVREIWIQLTSDDVICNVPFFILISSFLLISSYALTRELWRFLDLVCSCHNTIDFSPPLTWYIFCLLHSVFFLSHVHIFRNTNSV